MSFLIDSKNPELRASIVSAPVFAAEWDETRRRLTVHTCGRNAKSISRRKGLLSSVDASTRVVIKTHGRRALQSPRSLEALAQTIRSGSIVYDPTQIFTRAKLLVQAVKAARVEFSREISGFYFHAASRALVVVAQRDLPADRRAELGRQISARLQAVELAGNMAGFPVRVVDSLPQFGVCVAIDDLSIRRPRYWRALVGGAVASLISSGMVMGAAHAKSVSDASVLNSLSVFAEDSASMASSAFTEVGMAFFFGEDGATSRIEVQLAQGAPGDGGPGLRIVVTPLPKDDGPELTRPSFSPYTAGAGPGS